MLLILGLLSGPALADEVQLSSGAVLEARLGSFDRAGDCALEVTGGELEGALVVLPCADIQRFRRVEPEALGAETGEVEPVISEVSEVSGDPAAAAAPGAPAAEVEELAVDAAGAPPVLLIGEDAPELVAEALPAPAPALPVLVQEPVEAPAASQPVELAQSGGAPAPEASAVEAVAEPAALPATPAVDPAAKLALPEAAPVRRASLPGHLSPPGSAYEAAEAVEAVEAPATPAPAAGAPEAAAVEAPAPEPSSLEAPAGTVREAPRLDPSPQEAPQSALEAPPAEGPEAAGDGLVVDDGAPFPRLRRKVGTVVEGWYSGAAEGEATLEE